MRLRTVLALVAGLLLASPASAHDHWLEFSPKAAQTGGDLELSLWVGDDFVSEKQKKLEKARIAALRVITSAGTQDLLEDATEGASPLLRYTPKSPGGHLFALERSPVHIRLRARKFNHYLEHEGLSHALEQRRAAAEHLWPGLERYTRYLKAYVQVDGRGDDVSTKILGQRIELVPDRELGTLTSGQKLSFRVLFEGEPLAGLQVEAFVRLGEAARGQLATSDADGRVEFKVEQPGLWLVRTVHMQRCVGCKGADWESFWAGYTFAVG